MNGYLLDTHVWFWFVVGSGRLPPILQDTIDKELQNCWLSPISIWELGLLHEKKRIDTSGTLASWIEAALERFPLRDAPLNRDVVLVANSLALPHRDPGDRFIAATAVHFGFTLLTVDRVLLELDWLNTLHV